METFKSASYETTDMLMELWQKELGEIEIPVDQSAVAIAGILYEGIEESYGSNGSLPLQYHNPAHSLDVARRQLRIWRECHKVLPGSFPKGDFGLTLIDSMGHDRAHHTPDRSQDERISAEITNKVMHTRPNIYSTAVCQRVGRAIMATQVEFNAEGNIVQTRLRQGDRDPLKLSLAYADINGIAMEGTERMIRDAVALFMELNGHGSLYEAARDMDKLVDFLGSQAAFLRSRLLAMPGDIAHYFPDSEEAISIALVFAELFKPSEFALNTAEFLQDKPLIQTTLKGLSINSLDDLTSFVKHFCSEVTRIMRLGKSATA